MFRGHSKERLTGLAQRALAVGMLAGVVMLAWSLLISPLWTEYTAKNAQIVAKKELLARYLHVAKLETVVNDSGNRAGAGGNDADAFVADSGAIAGAQLQAQLKSIAASNRVSFRSARALPLRKGDDSQMIGVRVHVSGALRDIHKLTHAIERSAPYMFINAAQITTSRAREQRPQKPVIPLEVQLDVYGVFRPKATP